MDTRGGSSGRRTRDSAANLSGEEKIKSKVGTRTELKPAGWVENRMEGSWRKGRKWELASKANTQRQIKQREKKGQRQEMYMPAKETLSPKPVSHFPFQ